MRLQLFFGDRGDERDMPSQNGSLALLDIGPPWQAQQTAVDIKYVSYSLAYLKYLNKYALTTKVSTYVNTFVCQNYLCKIVLLCIFVPACQNGTLCNCHRRQEPFCADCKT